MEKNKKYIGNWKFNKEKSNTPGIEGCLYNENGKWILELNKFYILNYISNYAHDYIPDNSLNYIPQNIEDKIPDKINFIKGKLKNGEYITLLDIDIKSINIISKKVCYDSFIIIKGKYYDSIEDIKFKNIYVEGKQIQKWIPNKSIKVIKNENNEISLEFKELREKNFIEFEFFKALTYHEIINEVTEISNLFSVLTYNKISMGRMIKDNNGNEILTNNINELENNKEIIAYTDIKEDLNTIIKNWNNKKEKLLDIVNIFIELLSETIAIPIEVLFLLVLQGLESVSRRFRNLEEKENLEEKINELCNELPEKEKREFFKKILKSIDEQKLRDIFRINEISFRKRLKELLKESKIELEGINSNKKNKLVDDIINTRNYHTHLYEIDENKIIGDTDFYFYVMGYLKIVLYELILKELGINNEKIIKKIEKKCSYVIKTVIEMYK